MHFHLNANIEHYTIMNTKMKPKKEQVKKKKQQTK